MSHGCFESAQPSHDERLELEVARLDGELFRVARVRGRGRLRLGQYLNRLGDGFRELGFPSFAAYSKEVCSRGAQWSAVTRSVARKLDSLARMKLAVERGDIGWSMAELLARNASVEDEGLVLAKAQVSTVREMKQWLKHYRAHAGAVLVNTRSSAAMERTISGPASEAALVDDNLRGTRRASLALHGVPEELRRTLRLRLPMHEALALEQTRDVVELIGVDSGDWLDALLAECQGTLLGLAPSLAQELDGGFEAQVEELRRRAERLQKLREAEEREAEALIAEPTGLALDEDYVSRAATPVELHNAIAGVVAELSSRDLYLGRLAERFLKLRGWQRLGYASEAQYCRERLGISRSTFRAKEKLARESVGFELLVDAIQEGRIGSEQAALVLRVATFDVEAPWVARAEKRTFKHLKQEVEALELAVRYGGAGQLEDDHGDVESLHPPTDAELALVAAVKREMLSGRILRAAVGQSREGEAEELEQSLEEPDCTDDIRPSFRRLLQGMRTAIVGDESPSELAGPEIETAETEEAQSSQQIVQMFTGVSPTGKVSVLVPVRDDTAIFFQRMRRLYERHGLHQVEVGGQSLSFVEYMLLNFWRVWGPVLGQSNKWEPVHRRDNYECVNPVCDSHDVTLHHVTYKSRGGTDEDDNVVSLCPNCHLFGEHEGRLKVRGDASKLRWELGREPVMVIEGRDKQGVQSAQIFG